MDKICCNYIIKLNITITENKRLLLIGSSLFFAYSVVLFCIITISLVLMLLFRTLQWGPNPAFFKTTASLLHYYTTLAPVFRAG